MLGAILKIVFGVLLGAALLIAVVVALGTDLIAQETRPTWRRSVRHARAPIRTLKEART